MPARVVRSGEPFSMVALTWQGPAPETMLVRHRERGGWSDWSRLGRLDSARGGQRSGSKALWTGRTTAVQVRATRGGEDVAAGLTLVAISPSQAPVTRSTSVTSSASVTRSTTASRTRGGAPVRPPVVTRSEWGADESLMTWPPRYTASTRAAVVHHTAGTNDYSCHESAEIVRGIYYYHAVELGWGDIGYQALVDKCGTIFQGRTDGLRHDVVGGHTRGFNRRTFGVSMLGSFGSVRPSRAAVQAVGSIIGWKLAVSDVDPYGHTLLVSGGGEDNEYPEGTSVRLPTVFAHRDVNTTACPGDLGYRRLPEIRDIAAHWQHPIQQLP